MIEVGEYVKIKNGDIGRITQIYYDNQKCKLLRQGTWEEKHYIDKLERHCKHSKRPVDLIEKGDFVNKELVVGIISVVNINEREIGKKIITEYRSAQYDGLDNRHYIFEDDIKTILTKEQYERYAYRVEE